MWLFSLLKLKLCKWICYGKAQMRNGTVLEYCNSWRVFKVSYKSQTNNYPNVYWNFFQVNKIDYFPLSFESVTICLHLKSKCYVRFSKLALVCQPEFLVSDLFAILLLLCFLTLKLTYTYFLDYFTVFLPWSLHLFGIVYSKLYRFLVVQFCIYLHLAIATHSK